ncbi:hypothetical protein VTJ04DRAFT_725 [Mycothermus thermophilus]|uniref:uncharacterized protein n=1 Tax=Humicola insolens TaxID=85995 RepID=UPI0037432CDA
MSRTTTLRKYGKKSRSTKAGELFATLPPTPVKAPPVPVTLETEQTDGCQNDPKRDSGVDFQEQQPGGGCVTTDVDEVSKLLDAATLDPAPSPAQQTPTRNDKTLRSPAARRRRGSRRPPPDEDRSDAPSPPPHQRTSRSSQPNAKRAAASATTTTKPTSKPTATARSRAATPTSPEPETEKAPADIHPPQKQILLDDLEELTWTELLADCTKIEKIGEASYAEVYRITGADGASTSVLKAVRLEGHPIKPQTAAQIRARLVDEEPHRADEVAAELQMAEWLADIPGFLAYKGRYLVRGKATKELVAAHQVFQRREKRRDPGRLQWYPSPTRYLEETEFLVMEVADAGKPLEDVEVRTVEEVWDVLLMTALALARGEDVLEFEHRDLHEGNICVKHVRQPTPRPPNTRRRLGFSGVEVTLLDYGLSRVTCPDNAPPSSMPGSTPTPAGHAIALDLEQDLSIFQSTHAPHCQVYRQMRSFLIHGDPTVAAGPEDHKAPYPETWVEPEFADFDPADNDGQEPLELVPGGKLTWAIYAPYTNVLWLAHLYETLTTAPVWAGSQRELDKFLAETEELRACLGARALREGWGFECAGDVIRFAIEEGWVEVWQVEDCGGEEEGEGE